MLPVVVVVLPVVVEVSGVVVWLFEVVGVLEVVVELSPGTVVVVVVCVDVVDV